MQKFVPWSAFIALTEPPYSSSGRVGRTHIGVARMLHMYFLQQWNSLIDEGLQDAVHDSQAVREFVGIDLARAPKLFLTDKSAAASARARSSRRISRCSLGWRACRSRSAVLPTRSAAALIAGISAAAPPKPLTA